MDEKEIRLLLDKLADVKSQIDVVELKKQEAIDAVLTPEIRQQISDIEAEFAGMTQAAAENAKDLEEEIKAAIIKYGVSVKGEFLQAVYNKGRASFETERVKAYLQSHGVLDDYYKQGDPYVVIRKA